MVFGPDEPTGAPSQVTTEPLQSTGGLVGPAPYDSFRVPASSQANGQRGEPSKGES